MFIGNTYFIKFEDCIDEEYDDEDNTIESLNYGKVNDLIKKFSHHDIVACNPKYNGIYEGFNDFLVKKYGFVVLKEIVNTKTGNVLELLIRKGLPIDTASIQDVDLIRPHMFIPHTCIETAQLCACCGLRYFSISTPVTDSNGWSVIKVKEYLSTIMHILEQTLSIGCMRVGSKVPSNHSLIVLPASIVRGVRNYKVIKINDEFILVINHYAKLGGGASIRSKFHDFIMRG